MLRISHTVLGDSCNAQLNAKDVASNANDSALDFDFSEDVLSMIIARNKSSHHLDKRDCSSIYIVQLVCQLDGCSLNEISVRLTTH